VRESLEEYPQITPITQIQCKDKESNLCNRCNLWIRNHYSFLNQSPQEPDNTRQRPATFGAFAVLLNKAAISPLSIVFVADNISARMIAKLDPSIAC